MVTLRDVKAAAKAIGATVEDGKCGNTHECRVEAPKGHRWMADGLHEFVDAANIPWKPDYADLLDRMEYGVEDCPDADCEWCHPEEAE